METHVHTHARTHMLLPLPGSYHYPSLHPQFAISQPNRSHPINLFDFGAAYLSPSHLLSISPFHTIQYLCLTTLTQLSPANKLYQFQKLLKYPAPLSSLPFSAVLSNYFYALLKNSDSPTFSNLPLTPLFSLYLTFL